MQHAVISQSGKEKRWFLVRFKINPDSPLTDHGIFRLLTRAVLNGVIRLSNRSIGVYKSVGFYIHSVMFSTSNEHIVIFLSKWFSLDIIFCASFPWTWLHYYHEFRLLNFTLFSNFYLTGRKYMVFWRLKFWLKIQVFNTIITNH